MRDEREVCHPADVASAADERAAQVIEVTDEACGLFGS